nr:MAG TPA: hypothetical protein [Caudoviricetes sp.]
MEGKKNPKNAHKYGLFCHVKSMSNPCQTYKNQ